MFSFFKKKINPKEKLKETLKGFEMPSFSGVILQILKQIRNPYSSANDIAEKLSLDPGLSLKLMSIANSAAFSPTKKIENLTQAISLVGLFQLESLVLGVGVAKSLPSKTCQWHDPAEFWLTSARRAMLAQGLTKLLCPAKESECFTAAFLQDMALPILACIRLDDYEPIFKTWHLEGGDLAELERDVLEWDHAEVATWICSEWEVPENIAFAIKEHHEPKTAEDRDFMGPVKLVGMLREDESNSGLDEIIERARNDYGIKEDSIKAMIEPAFEKAGEIAKMIA